MTCKFYYYPILQVINWGFYQGTQLVIPETGFKPTLPSSHCSTICLNAFFLIGFSKNMNYRGNGDCVDLITPHIYIVFICQMSSYLRFFNLLLDIKSLKEVKWLAQGFLVSGMLSSEEVTVGFKSRTLPISALTTSFTSAELQKVNSHLPLLGYFHIVLSLHRFTNSKIHQQGSGLNQFMPSSSSSPSL